MGTAIEQGHFRILPQVCGQRLASRGCVGRYRCRELHAVTIETLANGLGLQTMPRQEGAEAKTLEINGPLTTCIAGVKAMLQEIEHSITIQNEGFEKLISGSRVMMDEVLRRAPENWYLEAQEAKTLGLIRHIT